MKYLTFVVSKHGNIVHCYHSFKQSTGKFVAHLGMTFFTENILFSYLLFVHNVFVDCDLKYCL